jgi:hypothetical protein
MYAAPQSGALLDDIFEERNPEPSSPGGKKSV